MASKGQQTVVHVTKFNLDNPEQAGGSRVSGLAAAAAAASPPLPEAAPNRHPVRCLLSGFVSGAPLVCHRLCLSLAFKPILCRR